MELKERLKIARSNVASLQVEFNRVSTLLTKWQGVCEWLESVLAEEAKGNNNQGKPVEEQVKKK